MKKFCIVQPVFRAAYHFNNIIQNFHLPFFLGYEDIKQGQGVFASELSLLDISK